jgi:polysaccharide deacetylase family protein (PEP-CTERM system associated)
LGAVAERFPEIIGDLARDGHEIGCHSHLHQFVYRQTPDEFRADLVRARDTIAAAAGITPTGYRAPYFSIREDSRWALEILADEGFRYDSSIFPVRNHRYGIPHAQRVPFEIATPSGSVYEVPLTPIQIAGKNVAFSGGAYLRILPAAVQRLAWKAAERQHMRVVAYIHPWELDPEHPRVPLRRRVAATHYARLGVTERRLRALFRAHRFGRLDDVFAVA